MYTDLNAAFMNAFSRVSPLEHCVEQQSPFSKCAEIFIRYIPVMFCLNNRDNVFYTLQYKDVYSRTIEILQRTRILKSNFGLKIHS